MFAEHLREKGVRFQQVACQYPELPSNDKQLSQVSLSAVARFLYLQDTTGSLLLLIKADKLLEINLLNQQLRRKFAHARSLYHLELATAELALSGHHPVVMDQDLENLEWIFVETLSREQMVRVKPTDLHSVYGNLVSIELGHGVNEHRDYLKHNDFKTIRLSQRLQELDALPVMPPSATALLKLSADPLAGASELAALVEKDPSLAAQVIGWASSPLYGYKGHINCVEDAIVRVLGYDLVLNIALALCVGKTFNLPREGRLGSQNFWRSAIYAAVVVEKLVRRIPYKQRPPVGLAYLCGLIHNIGHLVLGHLYPQQFKHLNELMQSNTHIDVCSIEEQLFGMHHAHIGAALLTRWDVPAPIITAVANHHEDAPDADDMLTGLTIAATRILARLNMGDATSISIPVAVRQRLNLSEADIADTLEHLQQSQAELNQLSDQLG